MAKPNPVTKRLERLYEQWIDFTDGDKKLLRWVIDDDEERMVETFVNLENSEGGRLPDLFVRLIQPFVNPRTYALELRQVLLQQYEAIDEELDLGKWEPPPATSDEDGVTSLVEACASLREHGREKGLPIEHVVLVLLPPGVADVAEWNIWLARLARAIDDPSIRVAVVDFTGVDALQPLADELPEFVHSTKADLDMPNALLEISAQAGKLDTPPGQFRHTYVQLLNAVGDGKLDTAKTLASHAIAIATAQGWWHLVLSVNFALGSGFLGRSNASEAIRWFRRAEKNAIDAESEPPLGGNGKQPDEAEPKPDETAKSLRVKCRLGMAAAAYSANAFVEAAKVYIETSPLAAEIDDQRTVLDCHRMASHCHDRAGKHQPAWDEGLKALKVGDGMDEETRRTSTLAHAGESMLFYTKRSQFRPHRPAIESEMERLLGKDWRPISEAPP